MYDGLQQRGVGALVDSPGLTPRLWLAELAVGVLRDIRRGLRRARRVARACHAPRLRGHALLGGSERAVGALRHEHVATGGRDETAHPEWGRIGVHAAERVADRADVRPVDVEVHEPAAGGE